MRKLILLAVTILMVCTAKAQFSDFTYGVKGGLNVTNLSKIDVDNKISYHVGAFAEWSISERFSIQPELVYSRQGCQVYDDKDNYIKTRVNYLNLPILAKFYVMEGLSIELGPQVGYVIGEKAKVKEAGKSSINDLKHVKPFDLSVAAGVAYSMDNIILSARYNFGFTDVFEKDKMGNTNNQNRVFQLSVGYRLSDIF